MSLCGRPIGWLEKFVSCSGVLNLGKIMSKSLDSESRDLALAEDCLLAMKELMAFDGGVEALSGSEKCVSSLLNCVEVMEKERLKSDALSVMTATILKSVTGSENVVAALVRSDAKNKSSEAPLKAMVEMLRDCGDDLRISIVMLLTSVLGKQSRDDMFESSSLVSRDAIIDLLNQYELAEILDTLLRSTEDRELKTLINVFREKYPDFRLKNEHVMFNELNQSLKADQRAHASFVNILEQLEKLDKSEAVWLCLESFIRSCVSIPCVDGKAETWFNSVLSANMDKNANTDMRVQALTAQLEVANRVMENCAVCSKASQSSSPAVNPVVLMRSLKQSSAVNAVVQQHFKEESSDESSEFVDIDLDGVKCATKSEFSAAFNSFRKAGQADSTKLEKRQSVQDIFNKPSSPERACSPPARLDGSASSLTKLEKRKSVQGIFLRESGSKSVTTVLRESKSKSVNTSPRMEGNFTNEGTKHRSLEDIGHLDDLMMQQSEEEEKEALNDLRSFVRKKSNC